MFCQKDVGGFLSILTFRWLEIQSPFPCLGFSEPWETQATQCNIASWPNTNLHRITETRYHQFLNDIKSVDSAPPIVAIGLGLFDVLNLTRIHFSAVHLSGETNLCCKNLRFLPRPCPVERGQRQCASHPTMDMAQLSPQKSYLQTKRADASSWTIGVFVQKLMSPSWIMWRKAHAL